ncbi:YlxR family protein [Mycoplasmopsis edwardii]|nr:YlxR family protein [Mycoplasmopsis edwardii]
MKMTENNSFTRKCIVTNQIIEVSNLIRFDYKKQTNEIKIDWNNNLNGRGAYFIPTVDNWQKLKKTKSLNRVFKTNFTFEKYEEIEKELKELLWAKRITE